MLCTTAHRVTTIASAPKYPFTSLMTTRIVLVYIYTLLRMSQIIHSVHCIMKINNSKQTHISFEKCTYIFKYHHSVNKFHSSYLKMYNMQIKVLPKTYTFDHLHRSCTHDMHLSVHYSVFYIFPCVIYRFLNNMCLIFHVLLRQDARFITNIVQGKNCTT